MNPSHPRRAVRVLATLLVTSLLTVLGTAVGAAAAPGVGRPAAGGQAALGAAVQASASTPAPGKMSSCPQGMAREARVHFVVYACNGTAPATTKEQIATTLDMLESLYGPMTAYMGKTPRPDPGNSAKDGPSRIDFYLLNSNQKLFRAGPCASGCDLDGADGVTAPEATSLTSTASSAFVLIDRGLFDSSLYFKSALAHEFFHVLQDAYNDKFSCSHFWFSEASAVWAEWHFVPQAAKDAVYQYFGDYLQVDPSVSLTSSEGDPYGKFVWPVFMQQHAEVGSIAAAWKAMDGKTGCAALNNAINAQLPFTDNFQAFAVENFDSELGNLHTGAVEWPADFGGAGKPAGPKTDYPDFTDEYNPEAPPFPEHVPAFTTSTPDYSSYPWKTAGNVDLPPLSAQYIYVPAYAASVELDFSGLSNVGDLDVNLIGAEESPFDALVNDGEWERVQVNGSSASICFDADLTDQSYGLPVDDVFVVLDNHDDSEAISGSYTVTARAACATQLSGTLKLNTTSDNDGDEIHRQATLNLILTMAGAYPNFTWNAAKGSTWSENYNETEKNGDTITASGGGPLNSGDLGEDNVTYDPDAYQGAYSIPPSIGTDLLSTESMQGTETTSAGPVSTTVSAAIGTGCPQAQYLNDFQGSYTSQDAGVDFSCTDSISSGGVTDTNDMSGTLTATGPLTCGLWTPDNCSVGSPATSPAIYPEMAAYLAGLVPAPPRNVAWWISRMW
jgi:hypothetical protein